MNTVVNVCMGVLLAVGYFRFIVNPSINETESAEYLSSQRELFRGLNGLSDEYDLVIVGAGLSGSVIAQQASARAGLRSLIIDKRDHIGGNCFDYVDEHGIRVSNRRKLLRLCG